MDGINTYSCQCPDNFVGAYCQTALWPCSFRPCLNGGTCSNNASYSAMMLSLVNSVGFLCHCPVGFTGPRCENVVDWCHGSNVPCRNGATCVQLEHWFECLCAPGWTGPICDVRNVSCDVASSLGQFTHFSWCGLLLHRGVLASEG